MAYLYQTEGRVYPACPRRIGPSFEYSRSCEMLSDRAAKDVWPLASDLHVRKMITGEKQNNTFRSWWFLCWTDQHGVLQASSDCTCIMVAEVALAKALCRGAAMLPEGIARWAA